MAGWKAGSAEYENAINAVRVDIARIFAEAGHDDQTTYTNQYTLQNKQVDLSAGEKIPLDCSGDAIWLFLRFVDRSLIHPSGNIAVTSMVLDIAKHIHISCLLKMLNWYLLNVIDLFEENGDRVALADGQKAMLHIFARLWKIRIKSEWKRSKRIRKMDEEEMSTSMEEWLTARLRPGEPGS
ncbi:hypothetical protein D6D13_09012 [Aureobasidium pullulans]|uniref:Uncharacterized protein n=1 Tax=Aureobasidium pullulans TaxID=5580 RepID=A0A4S9C5P0_AURPU|nr:hypothetical protein D6D13_09012 [Aureobasidium pullulans]